MKKQLENKKAVASIYSRVREILETARCSAYRAVNFAMVQAYWHIGRVIVEDEQQGKAKADYGEYLLKELSLRLTKDFGKGFDPSNLRYMRLFYLSFENVNSVCSQSVGVEICDAVRHISLPAQKGHALRDELPVIRPELSWTHYRLLLKVERPEVRKFYLDECIAANWSTRQLERQINSFYYERLLASRNKNPVRSEIKKLEPGPTPYDIIKDPYVLEFLGLEKHERHLEKDIEQALIDKLQHFLLELGKGFSFVARQQRITLDGDHFYIDLVFYNRLTRSFVLIDLKVGKLTHQDIGQMQMYLNYYRRTQMVDGENEPIGIVLCAEKNDAVVRYTLPEGKKRIFASRYKLHLPTEKELAAELIKERKAIEMERKLQGE